MNIITSLFIASLFSYLMIELWLNHKNQQHILAHRAQVPTDFSDILKLEEHQKAADYSLIKLSVAKLGLFVDSLLLLIMTIGGGFQAIYDLWQASHLLSGAGQDVAFLLSVFALMSFVGLPFSLYSTFVVEQKFGFNKTTPVKFVTDLLKQWALMLILGVPLLWGMVAIMNAFIDDVWWLYAWAGWMVFNVLLLWAFPIWIAPLFNKFTPLVDGEMKDRIEALLAKTGFNSNGIFVMDGSSRSGHGNAYFTGLGKNKRIVFYDTLLEKLTVDEVEAVLAHELGHFKHGHIKQRFIEGALMSLAGLALLGWLVQLPEFYSGLGMTTQSPAIALLLFMTVVPTLFFWLSPLMAIKSRTHEFEADTFAAQHASAASLVSALLGMYRDNASTLTPHPLYSAYHDSHPPAKIRIDHLKSLQS
jgi:STE24 endopeptidase